MVKDMLSIMRILTVLSALFLILVGVMWLKDSIGAGIESDVESGPIEDTLIDVMKDLRESMGKLNEVLREFENIKEETIGKASSGSTDDRE